MEDTGKSTNALMAAFETLKPADIRKILEAGERILETRRRNAFGQVLVELSKHFPETTVALSPDVDDFVISVPANSIDAISNLVAMAGLLLVDGGIRFRMAIEAGETFSFRLTTGLGIPTEFDDPSTTRMAVSEALKLFQQE
jgi:hypothetical protein